MESETLGFIGAGNMASSLIRGLLTKGANPDAILVADIDENKLVHLNRECGIKRSTNQVIADNADTIVLAVKPQVMKSVCSALTLGKHAPLVVSVAAGIPLKNLEAWLGHATAIVRCMPNTPALIGRGASGLFANDKASSSQKDTARELMAAVGIGVWVETETAIDAVTALSGSGPAYFFLFLEAMQDAARAMGLSEEVAVPLSLQTALGAAELAIHGSDDVAELRRNVTSPGGTTERALEEFEAGGLGKLVERALLAARDRSQELAEESDVN